MILDLPTAQRPASLAQRPDSIVARFDGQPCPGLVQAGKTALKWHFAPLQCVVACVREIFETILFASRLHGGECWDQSFPGQVGWRTLESCRCPG